MCFKAYLARLINGDGIFDIRNINDKLVLKAFGLKMHNRDINVLNYVKNILIIGIIISVYNTEYSLYVVSTLWEMAIIINWINGLIRLKVPSYLKAYKFLNINFIKAVYILEPFDPFFVG